MAMRFPQGMPALISHLDRALEASEPGEAAAWELGVRVKSFQKAWGGVEAIPSAVLCLVALSEREDGPRLLLTQRTFKVQSHQGQIAFPGGVSDPGEDVLTTALREAREEIGLDAAWVRIVGKLPGLPTVATRYWISPFVAVLERASAEALLLQPSPDEIDHCFWVTFAELMAPGVHSLEWREREGLRIPIHTFTVRDYRIWGATGFMIQNLLERWRVAR